MNFGVYIQPVQHYDVRVLGLIFLHGDSEIAFLQFFLKNNYKNGNSCALIVGCIRFINAQHEMLDLSQYTLISLSVYKLNNALYVYAKSLIPILTKFGTKVQTDININAARGLRN